MPRIRQVIMVSTSDRNSEVSPTATMNWPKVLATPVSVIVPTMMPTMAQAIPTGRAVLAPSASASRVRSSVSRPPRNRAQRAISTASAMTTGRMPYSKKAAAERPRPIQKT